MHLRTRPWPAISSVDGVVFSGKMAFQKNHFRSTVADIIDFRPLETPPWRTNPGSHPSTEDMVKDIVKFKKKWDSKSKSLDGGIVDDVRHKLEAKFFHHCNVGEDHGLKNLDMLELFLNSKNEFLIDECKKLSQEEQESLNLRDAYVYLLNEAERDKDCHGLLEESMLREVNKIILRNIPLAKNSTKPGVFSNKPRMTTFNGETYFYQQPEDMMSAVCTLLDRFNSLLTHSLNLPSTEEQIENVFKSVAWLAFELLDLHPFSDGNGRVCRLLCSYVLNVICPFPSPIYNMYSESSVQDFEQTLVKTRQSVERKPEGLTTMIIESNWAFWKKLNQIEQEIENKLTCVQPNTPNDLTRTCAHSAVSAPERNVYVEHKVGA